MGSQASRESTDAAAVGSISGSSCRGVVIDGADYQCHNNGFDFDLRWAGMDYKRMRKW